MMEQVDKHDKRVTTSEDFISEKKISDIIYGFYQLHSHFDGKDTYCFKKDVTYAKIQEYFKSNAADPKNRKAPVSDRTLTRINKLLLESGFIQKTKKNGKAVFILPNTTDFVWVKYETLRFLVNACTPGCIKTYAYLKRWFQYKQSRKEEFWFTKKELLSVLGLHSSVSPDYTRINDILNTLTNNGLIETELRYFKGENGQPVPNYILKDVREDFIHDKNIYHPNHNKSKIADIEMPIALDDDINKPAVPFDFTSFHF